MWRRTFTGTSLNNLITGTSLNNSITGASMNNWITLALPLESVISIVTTFCLNFQYQTWISPYGEEHKPSQKVGSLQNYWGHTCPSWQSCGSWGRLQVSVLPSPVAVASPSAMLKLDPTAPYPTASQTRPWEIFHGSLKAFPWVEGWNFPQLL